MNNKAICRKTDEHFTEGKEYECTAAYARYESAVVDILDNNKELITVEINDADFQFIFKIPSGNSRPFNDRDENVFYFRFQYLKNKINCFTSAFRISVKKSRSLQCDIL